MGVEKDKALAGLEFLRGDSDLRAGRERAERLCFEFNHTNPDDVARKDEIIRSLIGEIKGSYFFKAPLIVEYGDYISIGDNFFANYNCKFMDGGKITFGNDVMIGPDCTFVTATHPIEPDRRLAGYETFKPITVGDNVWIGAGVIVTPGVTIGNNCVIGAGSVVVKDVPANSVAVGNPCKVIKKV